MDVLAPRSLLADMVRNFSRSWPQLAVAHVLSNVITAVLLTPLATLLLRLYVEFSGDPAITDLDIAYFFFLKPIGIVGLVLGGAVAVAISAFELAVLICIGVAGSRVRVVGWRD